MSDEAGTLIFVYGTLKRGCSNHDSMYGQTFVGQATTMPGFRLFSLGDYPGLVRWEDDSGMVHGEVWRIDDECLAHLDVLEGVAEGLYRRERVPLQPPFERENVVSYVYALSVLGRADVGSSWVE